MSNPFKLLCAGIVPVALAILSGTAYAQEYTIALFTPGLDFKDGVARNDYAQKIAEKLSSATGNTWKALAFARAADFENAKNKITVAIVDADYYATKLTGHTPVAQLAASNASSLKMRIVSKNSAGELHNFRGKRLALVSNSGLSKKFLTATALGNEISADEYFSLEEVRDMRSALNALDLGKADLVMTLDGYHTGYNTVYTGPAYPLPVIVLFADVDRQTQDKIKSTVQKLSVSAASVITSSKSYDAGSVASLKSPPDSSPNLQYTLIKRDISSYSLHPANLKEKDNFIPLSTETVSFTPSLHNFDHNLESEI